MSTELEALQGIMQDIVKLGYRRSGTKTEKAADKGEIGAQNEEKDEDEED